MYLKASTLLRNNLEFSYQVLVSIMTTQRRILFDHIQLLILKFHFLVSGKTYWHNLQPHIIKLKKLNVCYRVAKQKTRKLLIIVPDAGTCNDCWVLLGSLLYSRVHKKRNKLKTTSLSWQSVSSVTPRTKKLQYDM